MNSGVLSQSATKRDAWCDAPETYGRGRWVNNSAGGVGSPLYLLFHTIDADNLSELTKNVGLPFVLDRYPDVLTSPYTYLDVVFALSGELISSAAYWRGFATKVDVETDPETYENYVNADDDDLRCALYCTVEISKLAQSDYDSLHLLHPTVESTSVRKLERCPLEKIYPLYPDDAIITTDPGYGQHLCMFICGLYLHDRCTEFQA